MLYIPSLRLISTASRNYYNYSRLKDRNFQRYINFNSNKTDNTMTLIYYQSKNRVVKLIQLLKNANVPALLEYLDLINAN